MFTVLRAVFIAAVALTTPNPAGAAHLGVAEVAALEKACEVAREAKLRPLRDAAVAACVAEGRRDEAACRHYYRDFGNAMRTPAGHLTPRRFHDLPACLAADAGARHLRLAPP